MSLQFPAAVSGVITLWPRWTDPLTKNHILVRTPLNGCFWNDNSISIFNRTGQQLQNSVEVYIPYDERVTGKRYVTPEEWTDLPYAELGNCWTLSIRLTPLPIMAEGDNLYTFDWGTPTQLAQAQNLFITNNPSVKTVRDLNLNFFGSKNMWHIALRGS